MKEHKPHPQKFDNSTNTLEWNKQGKISYQTLLEASLYSRLLSGL